MAIRRRNRAARTPVSPLVSLLLLLCLLRPQVARSAIHLPDRPAECVQWAAQDLEDALQEARVLPQAQVGVEIYPSADLPPESFALSVRGEAVRIAGGDDA